MNPKLKLVTTGASASWEDVSRVKDVVMAKKKPSIPVDTTSTEGDSWSAVFRKFDELRKRPVPSDINLLDQLAHFYDARCTDPVDRIYGLRALAHDGDKFVVDYGKSPFDLVVELAMHYAKESYESEGRQMRNFKAAIPASYLATDWQKIYERTGHLPEGYNTWLPPETAPRNWEHSVLGPGSKVYRHLFFRGSSPVLYRLNTINKAALLDDGSDWLIMPYTYVGHHDDGFDLSAFIQSRYNRRVKFLMNIEFWLGFNVIAGRCEAAKVIAASNNSAEVTNATRDILTTLLQTHTWHCQVGPWIHISRLLFAVLLHLICGANEGAIHPLEVTLPPSLMDHVNLQSSEASDYTRHCNCQHAVPELVCLFEEEVSSPKNEKALWAEQQRNGTDGEDGGVDSVDVQDVQDDENVFGEIDDVDGNSSDSSDSSR